MHGHRIAIGCGLALLFVLAFSAHAQAPGGPPPGPMAQGPQGRPEPPAFWKDATAVERLQLTTDQVAALEKLDAAFQKDARAIRRDVEKARLELELAFRQDKLDAKAIRALAEKVGSLEGKMTTRHLEHRLAVMQVLTADQRDKLDEPPCGGPQGPHGPHGDKGPQGGGRPEPR